MDDDEHEHDNSVAFSTTEISFFHCQPYPSIVYFFNATHFPPLAQKPVLHTHLCFLLHVTPSPRDLSQFITLQVPLVSVEAHVGAGVGAGVGAATHFPSLLAQKPVLHTQS